jgi:predicted O-methyltransferase YrrM
MEASFWLYPVAPTPSAHVLKLASDAEQRRSVASYNTGSILATEAQMLLDAVQRLCARVVIEVGTFVGLSTTALASGPTVEAVYTCDASNDCLPATATIRTYPKQSSTQMLRDLVARGVKADLCFFDGTVTPADVPLLAHVTSQDTVFIVHDYNHGPKWRKKQLVTVPRKGIGNVELLRKSFPSHVVVDPLPDTTLAAFLPKAMA